MLMFSYLRLTDRYNLFQNCLGIIYTVYIENIPIPLETLIGNILGSIQVPPPGGPQVRFSIGAGDRQALQPPLSPTLPVTNTSVYLLFQQLGMLGKLNFLSVFKFVKVSVNNTQTHAHNFCAKFWDRRKS